MKLLNHTNYYLSISMLVLTGVWAVIFYFSMLDEIYDGIDDGLENSKLLIIKKVNVDSTVLYKTEFFESNYSVNQISAGEAYSITDVYMDSALYMENEKEHEPVRILKTAFRAPNQRFYKLHIYSSMVEEDDLVKNLSYAVAGLYFVLLFTVLLVNNVILRKIWKPFYRLLDRLKTFKLGSQMPFAVEATNVKEFQILNSTVESLLQQNIETFESQKQFIENASHELQTPLAISINKLELFAEKSDLNESQMKDIGSVLETLQRLTRLNKSLLLLSKIENNQFSDVSSININTLIKKVVAGFSDLAAFKSVEIVIIEENTFHIELNPDLCDILFMNLIKNAIVHSVGGKVIIEVARLQVAVRNSGGVKALDENQIFTRFYKQSDKKENTGLGLAIAKSIADHYQLRLLYEFSSGQHQFTIDFAPARDN